MYDWLRVVTGIIRGYTYNTLLPLESLVYTYAHLHMQRVFLRSLLKGAQVAGDSQTSR